MFLIAHQIENDNAAIDMNFNSNPCNGYIASPPIIPSNAEREVVHAGHPGVNAVKAPPKIADVPLFLILFALCILMLYATSAILIPARIATIMVKPIDAVMYCGIMETSTLKWSIVVDSVRK